MKATWTLVPIRGLATGKTRLATVLGAQARRELCTSMLLGTLDAVAGACDGLARCIVVSADAQARAAAADRGAQVLDDPPQAMAGRTLDAALEAARASARAAGAGRLLVLSADMPGVDADALRHLLATAPPAGAVLLADKSGTGTNGMLIPADLPLPFAFGCGSLQRHRQALAALGVQAACSDDRRLAFDIDTPDDLHAWMHARGSPSDPLPSPATAGLAPA